MKQNRMRQIRKKLGYSIAEFAELLGLPKATLQCYDNDTRAIPLEIILKAEEELRWDAQFFKGMPGRIDKELGPNGCPNLARPGQF
jgi:transcriptional regulator with XRE-family HTH domain